MQQSGRVDSQIGKNLEFEVDEQCKFRGYETPADRATFQKTV